MDKQQALYNLWSGFNLPAYDENSVPDDAEMPYITYQVILADIDYPVFPSASLWYRSTSWNDIDLKQKEIASYIEDMQPILLDDGGYMYVTKGTPFAQRMVDEDKTVKRYYLNLAIEFLTKN